MNNLATVVSLCLLFFNPAAGAKKSDREQTGLKGDVRAVRIEQAFFTNKTGELKEDDRRVISIYKYDVQGSLAEQITYALGRVQSRRTYSRDAEGNRNEELVELEKIGDWNDAQAKKRQRRFRRVFKYDNEGRMIEERFYSGDGEQLEKINYSYDSKGRVEKTEETGNKLTGKRNCVIKYGDKGEKIESTCRNHRDDSLAKSTFTYEFDSNGNWIKSVTTSTFLKNGREGPPHKVAVYRTIVYGSPDREAEVAAAIAKLEDITPLPIPSGPFVIRKSGGVLQQEAIRKVTPSYPIEAVKARITGVVVVEVFIDEEGKVIGAKAISGPPELQDAAVNAAKGWLFRPTKLSGELVRVIGTISFNFKP